MNPIKSILSSEHGIFAILLVVAVTVLTAIGRMDVAAWTSYTQWIFGIFVGGHSLITIGGAIGSRTSPDAAPTPVVKQAASSITAAVMVIGCALIAATTMTACSASQKAQENAIENGVIDCGKAQVSLATLGDVLVAASGGNAQADLEALGIKDGEAVAACALQQVITVLAYKAPSAKPSTGEPTPNPTLDHATAFVARKGYRFK